MPSSSPTCRCGHTLDHHAVEPELDFSVWGWFALVILGITARPKKATWRCWQCNEVLKVSRDPRELKGLR